MAALLSTLQNDLNAARKNRHQAGVLLLGTTIADVRNREIELKRELADDDVIEVIRRGIKKRRESIDVYDKHARKDLADTERFQVDILGKYLPAAPADDEIRAAVRTAIVGGATNIGAVM